MSAVLRKPKTFKLRALHSQKKFGVAGKSCQEVLRKGCLHLQLPVHGSRLCLYEDGTELTGDYFWSIPNNSELVLLTEGQTWQGYVSDISCFLSMFHRPHVEVIQAARQLLSGEQAPLRQKLLADLLHTVSENITAETRAEDPPWFEGLESRFRNKSSYLRYSCESRIRSYLRETTLPPHTMTVCTRHAPGTRVSCLVENCPQLCAAQRSCYTEGKLRRAWPLPVLLMSDRPCPSRSPASLPRMHVLHWPPCGTS